MGWETRNMYVAQCELIAHTVRVVEGRRIRVNPSLAAANTVTNELLKFQRRITPKPIQDSCGQWRERA